MFIAFSGLVLALAVVGALGYWAQDPPAIRAITVFMCLLFASCVGLGISIGTVDWNEGFPWRHAATLLVFLLLGFGVRWARLAIS